MFRNIGNILMMLYMIASSFFISTHSTQNHSLQGKKIITEKHAFTADDVVLQVLQDENLNGWDPLAQGILTNWRRDDLTQVNCSPSYCEQRGNTTRHDSTVDLRDLEHLYWYKHRHPGNTSLNASIDRILPTVKREWGKTKVAEGWIYYILLRLARYSGDAAYWDRTAKAWAARQYQTLDPQLGVHHGALSLDSGGTHLQDAYRIDHELENGTALVDAGTRYHHPEWTTAGQREVNVVIQEGFSTTYHLFSRIYLISDPTYGTNKVIDYQAKAGEEGQEMEALLRTGLYTQNPDYLSHAAQMLNAMQSLPIHDQTNGGFYFKMYLGPYQGHQAGYVDKGSKETRQMHLLTAIHLGNSTLGNQWAGLEAEMIALATTPNKLFLPPPVPGFTYRLRPNWTLYRCSLCSPQPYENWVSAEADNIALEGLQTVLSPDMGQV